MSIKGILTRGLRFIISGVPTKNVTANVSYLQPSDRLLGKKIIVTGGGRGLGAAMAKKFVAEGAEVLIVGRNEETLRDTANKIACKFIVLDLQDTNKFNEFINRACQEMGGLDCLVNNAGISLHETTFFDVTPESFDKQIATNLKGAFFLTQSFISKLKELKQEGNVLFVSSETGNTADIRPYGLTKAAINSLVQGLAYLLAKEGIRVNAVAPGVTSSDMTGFKAEGNLYCSFNHTERVYLPEEVAETACFLLSEASGCISGQIITCNNAKTVNARWK